jgi:hypothetical protein
VYHKVHYLGAPVHLSSSKITSPFIMIVC